MNIINSIFNSELVQTGLSTIIGGNDILSPAIAIGNVLECTTNNEMLQTAGKISQ